MFGIGDDDDGDSCPTHNLTARKASPSDGDGLAKEDRNG